MAGLIVGLALGLSLGLLLGTALGRRKTERLLAQTEAFLEGNAPAMDLSLGDRANDRLQNALSRLQNQLLLSREQTHLEAQRSTNLLADISHQLKTPLASLQLFLELDGGPHLEQAQAQIQRMQHLIYSLLRLERLCADGYAFHFGAHDLRALAESCWQGLSPLYPKKQLLCTGMAALHCDSLWMGEALTNLLKNACEHTPPDGIIRLDIREDSREVRLTLSDNGGGADPKDLPRLFERFYHGDHPGHGVGIGLAIVREIVWRHHGSIQAENIPGGLQMSLSFPKLDAFLAKS